MLEANMTTAKQIFQAAKLYSSAAKELNGNVSFLIPSNVLAALSLELYFKSIYFSTKGCEFDKSHKIHEIFNALEQSLSSEILSSFDHEMKKVDKSKIIALERSFKLKIDLDLSSILTNWSKIFVEMRYFYDTPKYQLIAMFFPEIERAILDVVARKVPALVN
jgi:hypothetical protein